MLVKEISYVDYDGNERKEDFYFNISKAELAELEFSVDGGMKNIIERITKKQNNPEIMALFKRIILLSYGEKSNDGKRFIKSKELSESFVQTEAYTELFMELFTDSKAAADFINAVLPDISNLNKHSETPV